MNTFCYGQSKIVANASVTLFYVHALARQLDTIGYVHFCTRTPNTRYTVFGHTSFIAQFRSNSVYLYNVQHVESANDRQMRHAITKKYNFFFWVSLLQYKAF